MKSEIGDIVRSKRIIAIIRGFEPDICLRLAEAYAKGGIALVEVTFDQTRPGSWRDTAEAIKAIGERFAGSVRAGAGTVLTLEQLSMAEDAGGEFVVTPNVNPDIIRESVRRGLAAMPGAMTPTEAVDAVEAGADFVKLFPAGSLGVSYVKAVLAPLGHIPLLAVGGIGPENVADFMRAGCCGAGVGGNLSNREWIAAGEWGRIADVAASLMRNSEIHDNNVRGGSK